MWRRVGEGGEGNGVGGAGEGEGGGGADLETGLDVVTGRTWWSRRFLSRCTRLGLGGH